jgi:GT2 family glycosyltransferase
VTDVRALTVVIPTRERPEHVRAAVESVLAGTALPQEIVVVDQSAVPDQGLAAIDGGRCRVRYLSTRDNGVSRARNRGAREARNDVLAFIDDDVTVDREWLSAISSAMEHAGEHAAVTGQVAERVDPGGGFAPSLKVDPHSRSYRGRIRADVLFTGNMAIPRALVGELGWFDERLGAGASYPAAADNDFGLRLLKAGHEIVYEPRAVVYHAAWRMPRESRLLRWRYGVGQGAFYAKHLSLRDRFMLGRMTRDTSRRVARLPVLAVRDRRRAVGDAVYLAGLVTGIIRWFLTEHRR